MSEIDTETDAHRRPTDEESRRAGLPWEPYEDQRVAKMVMRGLAGGPVDIALCARILGRSYNAIVCRIELKYGKHTRLKLQDMPNTREEPFWIVYDPQYGNVVQGQFNTLREARTRAVTEQESCGRKMYVLKMVGYAEPPKQPTSKWVDIP